jgi:hypothetical protein
MATPNYSPFQSLSDPNSIFGPNFLRVAARRLFNSRNNPAAMAGSAGVNPTTSYNIPSFPQLGPLVRTDYGLPPSERPEYRDPAMQWDARPVAPRVPQTVGSGETISEQEAIARNNANMTDYERRAFGMLSLSPSSADVVRSVSQPPRTGIAGGTMRGIPEVATQYPQSLIQEPMAPITAGLGGAVERRGVRTAYGMVYPSAGQEQAAQRLAQAVPMSARLASVGENIVRPKVLKSRIDYVKNSPTSDDGSTMRNALEGLTQAEKIRIMRERGKQLGKERVRAMEEGFASRREQNRKEFEESERSRVLREAARTPANRTINTTQRSWSNYEGEDPIKGRVGTDFYKESRRYG